VKVALPKLAISKALPLLLVGAIFGCEEKGEISELEGKFGGTDSALQELDETETLAISPESFNFGTVVAGLTSKVQSFTLTNNIPSSVTITAITMEETSFSLVSTTCPLVVGSVAPAGTCDIIIKFESTEAESYATKLKIAYTNSLGKEFTSTAELSGTTATVSSIGNAALSFLPSY